MAGINVISLFDKSTVKHLRLPFSFHLMPVFLFALSQSGSINWYKTLMAFLILHVLIYPSSNGYNSYQDKDEESVGGLKHPPKVTENLFYVTLLMDIAGVLAAMTVNLWFSTMVLVYILVSRAYSYRRLRLKKYAIGGFLTVFIFQGGFTYLMCSSAFASGSIENNFGLDQLICMSIASFFIGSVYPLTQIYQHNADKKDGVTTISYRLGYDGTFFFSAGMFIIAVSLLFWYFTLRSQLMAFYLFNFIMIPVMIRLGAWYLKVRKDSTHANFENTMSMNLFASVFMNFYFTILILNKFFTWF